MFSVAVVSCVRGRENSRRGSWKDREGLIQIIR